MILPTRNKVLIRVATEEDLKASNIIIPESIKEASKDAYNPTFGAVVAVHPDLDVDFDRGDVVYFHKMSGTEIDLGDVMLLSIDNAMIVAWEAPGDMSLTKAEEKAGEQDAERRVEEKAEETVN